MNDTPPSTWDVAALTERWDALLAELTATSQLGMHAKRIRVQAEADRSVADVLERWPQMSGAERTGAWTELEQGARKAVAVPVPTCVRCGDCCRRSSPTLHPDDLDLVRAEKLPWSMLVTLRRGEPVRSPLKPEPFELLEEQIKLRERPCCHECSLYDAGHEACTVYLRRPIQCRVQACWDPREARELVEGPRLTRRTIFREVPPLLEVIEAHESRCPFDSLGTACARLAQTNGENADEVLDIVAFEDHFRTEVRARLGIPAPAMDFLFGRSFADSVHLFGLTVEEVDGIRTLVPRQTSS